jgi:hypothetical protein
MTVYEFLLTKGFFIMKKIIALVLACVLALSTVVFAADFKDMPNDWSTTALEAAVKNGLLTGSNGYIKASDNMTRAEMATIMVRACGATKEADISTYKDVKKSDWFYSSMAKAVEMGAFTGSGGGRLNPNNPITRQEAFVVLTRVFGLDKNITISEDVLSVFEDAEDVADWAQTGVGAIVSQGYVAGSNGYIKPLDNISRAEFAVVMDRLIKYYIDDATAQIPTDGNVMLRVAPKTIENLATDKMVVFGDGIGEAEIDIKASNINNKLVIRGGTDITVDGDFKDISIVCPGIQVAGAAKKGQKVYVCLDSTYFINTILIGGEEVKNDSK